MGKLITDLMEKVKRENTKESKLDFLNTLIKESFIVPIIANVQKDASGKDVIKEISHFSIENEKGSYLLIFTSTEELSKWKKDVQFIEIDFADVLSLVRSEQGQYTGIIIDKSTVNLSVSKNILEKIIKNED